MGLSGHPIISHELVIVDFEGRHFSGVVESEASKYRVTLSPSRQSQTSWQDKGWWGGALEGKFLLVWKCLHATWKEASRGVVQRVKTWVAGVQDGAKKKGRGLDEQVEAHLFLYRCRLKLTEGRREKAKGVPIKETSTPPSNSRSSSGPCWWGGLDLALQN